MALIHCPECGKEISDKAAFCPNCGFPLREYYDNEKKKMMQEEAIKQKKQAEQKRLSDLQKKNAERKRFTENKVEFHICGETFTYDGNDVICANVCNGLENVKSVILSDIGELLWTETREKPSDAAEAELFYDYIDKLTNEFITKLIDCAVEQLEKYYDPSYTDIEQYKERIKKKIESSDYIKTIHEKCNDSYGKYSFNVSMSQKNNVNIEELSSFEHPIDRVFASSYGELIKAKISADIINSVHSTLVKNIKNHIQAKQDDKYHQALIEEGLKLNTTVIKTFATEVEEIVTFLKEQILHELKKEGILADIRIYPKEEYDIDDVIDKLDDWECSNSQRKEIFIKACRANPADDEIYSTAIIDFAINDAYSYNELFKLISYFDIYDEVHSMLEDDPEDEESNDEDDNDDNNDDDAISYVTTNEVYRMACQIMDKVHQNKKINDDIDDFTYDILFMHAMDFSDDAVWYSPDILKSLEPLVTDWSNIKWQKQRFDLPKLYKMIINEIDNDSFRSLIPGINDICKLDGNYYFTFAHFVTEFRNGKESRDYFLHTMFANIPGLEGIYQKDELPIIIVGLSNRKIITFSTRALYIIQPEKPAKRYAYNDIRHSSFQIANDSDDSQYWRITTGKETVEILDNSVSEDEISHFDNFSVGLNNYARNNSQILRQSIRRCAENTSYNYLTREYLNIQLDNAAKKIAEKDYKHRKGAILKYAFQITENTFLGYNAAYNGLFKLIEANNIGTEFLFYIDDGVLATDRAMYGYSCDEFGRFDDPKFVWKNVNKELTPCKLNETQKNIRKEIDPNIDYLLQTIVDIIPQKKEEFEKEQEIIRRREEAQKEEKNTFISEFIKNKPFEGKFTFYMDKLMNGMVKAIKGTDSYLGFIINESYLVFKPQNNANDKEKTVLSKAKIENDYIIYARDNVILTSSYLIISNSDAIKVIKLSEITKILIYCGKQLNSMLIYRKDGSKEKIDVDQTDYSWAITCINVALRKIDKSNSNDYSFMEDNGPSSYLCGLCLSTDVVESKGMFNRIKYKCPNCGTIYDSLVKTRSSFSNSSLYKMEMDTVKDC